MKTQNHLLSFHKLWVPLRSAQIELADLFAWLVLQRGHHVYFQSFYIRGGMTLLVCTMILKHSLLIKDHCLHQC